jgi:hypothetical protein
MADGKEINKKERKGKTKARLMLHQHRYPVTGFGRYGTI